MKNINQENITKFILLEIEGDRDYGYPVSRRTLVAILDRIRELKPEWEEVLNYNEETGWLLAAIDGVSYYGPDDYYKRVMVEYKGEWDWKIFSEEDRKFLTHIAWDVRVEQSVLTDYPENRDAAYELRDKLIAAGVTNAEVEDYRREFETDDSWDVDWRIGLCHYSVSWFDGQEIWAHQIFRGGGGRVEHKFKIGEEPDLFKLMFLDNKLDAEAQKESQEWETKSHKDMLVGLCNSLRMTLAQRAIHSVLVEDADKQSVVWTTKDDAKITVIFYDDNRHAIHITKDCISQETTYTDKGMGFWDRYKELLASCECTDCKCNPCNHDNYCCNHARGIY